MITCKTCSSELLGVIDFKLKILDYTMQAKSTKKRNFKSIINEMGIF